MSCALLEKLQKIYQAIVVGKWNKVFILSMPLKKNILKSGEGIVTSNPAEGI